MPDTYNYPAEIACDEDGRHVVAFPDFGWGATDGATRDEALVKAKNLLRELVATTIREGKDLPEPSLAGKGQPLVVPPVEIALKAALYEAWRQAGISQRRLARDLDVAESEVRRNVESRTQHQGCNDRPRPAPAWKACECDRRRGSLMCCRTSRTTRALCVCNVLTRPCPIRARARYPRACTPRLIDGPAPRV